MDGVSVDAPILFGFILTVISFGTNAPDAAELELDCRTFKNTFTAVESCLHLLEAQQLVAFCSHKYGSLELILLHH